MFSYFLRDKRKADNLPAALSSPQVPATFSRIR